MEVPARLPPTHPPPPQCHLPTRRTRSFAHIHPQPAQAAELGDDRGALQKRLAAFLGRQPRGAVVLVSMHQVRPGSLVVVIRSAGGLPGVPGSARQCLPAG